MKSIWFALLCCVMLSSCATVFNKSHYDISFRSNRDDTKITINDSTYQLPAKVNVRRQHKNIPIVVKAADSVSENFTLHPVTDKKVWLNLIPTLYSPPLFLVDYLSPQHYTYGKEVRFVVDGDSIRAYNESYPRAILNNNAPGVKTYWKQDYPGGKGRLNLLVGIPVFNVLAIDNAFGKGESFNLFGLKAGIEYFYANDKFLSVNAAYILPTNDVGLLETFGPQDFTRHSQFYAMLSHNHTKPRFTYGYGLNYTRAQTHLVREINLNFDGTAVNHSFGANANFQFRFYKNLFVGVAYKPTFYRLDPNPGFSYEHLLSLEYIVKFGVRKARR